MEILDLKSEDFQKLLYLGFFACLTGTELISTQFK